MMNKKHCYKTYPDSTAEQKQRKGDKCPRCGSQNTDVCTMEGEYKDLVCYDCGYNT